MKKLTVIIVLFNEFELVKKCLSSVFNNSIPDMEVLLIDNSTDKIGHKNVLKKFPQIKYQQNKVNIGFGNAVNIGLQHAKGEFILVLTPDTYLLPETIKPTLQYIEIHKKVGLVGCRIYTSKIIQDRSAAKKYPNLLFVLYYYNMLFYKIINRIAPKWHPINYSAIEHEKILFPKYVMGAYMLIRRKTIEKVGLFDGRFKMYLEDVDLCKRIISFNWKVVYLPNGGLISGDGGEWKKTTITQALPNFMESLYLFFDKHNGKIYTIIAWIIGSVSSLISIPYLYFVINIKKLFNKPSQANELLPLWINIVKWHFTKGFELILLNKK